LTNQEKNKVMVVGAASSMGQLLCESLKSHYDLTGIDVEGLPEGTTFPGDFHQVGYTKRSIEELFRRQKYSSIIHLGRIPSKSIKSRGRRYEENVAGTQNILRLGLHHGVHNFIVLSTHVVYGASQRNHLYIREEEPSDAAARFPFLADSVEMDHEATEFLWQQRSVRTVVLRPVFVVGKHSDHAFAEALRRPVCPKVLGYNPLIQVIHEDDMIRAIILALKKKKRGIYNVAGEGVIPFSRAIEIAGSTEIPIPAIILKNSSAIFRMLGWRIPTDLVDFFRYPVVVSDQAFRRDFGYEPTISTVEAIKSNSASNYALAIKST
jgi:UDP-glucose 4-epimerase